MRARPFVVLAVSLFAAPLFAQVASLPPLTQRVEMKVINVDASVVDRQGRPVTNLTKDDFEIFEDGKPQKVTNFFLVDRAVVRDDTAASKGDASAEEPQGRFRRKVVLIVDNHFIEKRSRDQALFALKKFIDADFSGQYEWSIAVIGSGVHVLQPFSADKNTIKASIDLLTRGSTIASAVAIDNRAVADPDNRPDFTDSDDPAQVAQFRSRMAALADADRAIRATNMIAAMRSSARAVIDACRAYTSLEGKKIALLVTGGMEADNRPLQAVYNWHQSTGTATENDRAAGEIRELMVREANAANVSLYIVNAAGQMNPVEGMDAETGRSAEATFGYTHDNDSLAFALASQTGGMYLTSNRVAESIKKVDEVSGTFYSLGYSASHFEDRKYHTISVRVKKHPEYRVLHRTGYLDLSSRDRLEDSMKIAMSAAVPEGSLPVQLVLGKATPKAEHEITIPVTAMVPINRLTTIKQSDVNTGRVHVYVSLFDQSGVNVGFHHMVQQVDLSDEQMQQLATQPNSNFRYQMKLNVKPGVYNVIVALVDELSEELGKTTAVFDTKG